MTFCTNCGKKLPSGSTRCDACGATVIAAKPTPPESPNSGLHSVSDDLKTRISNPESGGGPLLTNSEATMPLQAVGAQVGRVLGGRYQLDQVIGSGGMGEIYRARRLHIGDTVAVKILRPDVVENEKSRQRFYREARAAAMLHHPNAVVIHDFGEDTDGTAYIVMELLVGRSLRQVLIDDGSVQAVRCSGIIRQACAALDAGHRNGIIHRDIKPDNIVLLDSNDGADHVKILDFGIAKLRDQALDTLSMEQRLTNVGTVIGTPHYMAPEQCQGEEADARSDIYSLGVVLYELLTGVAPFLAKTPTGVAIKHVTEKPRPLRELQPSVPEMVERVVLKALEKDPNARQQSALELAREFETAIRTEGRMDGATELPARSGEQPQLESGTLPLSGISQASKTEMISKPRDTGANRPRVAPPESFETSITPPLATDQLKDAATGKVFAPDKTSERDAATDALRKQAPPPTEILDPSSQTDILSPAQQSLKPEPFKAAPIDPLRTDPFIPAPEESKSPAVPPGKLPGTKVEPEKAQSRTETPLPSSPPTLPRAGQPAQAKSKIPLLAGLGAAVLILGTIGVWMMSGRQENQPSNTTTAASPAPAVTTAPSPLATSAFPEIAAPEGMVYILGGALQIGRDNGEGNERPAHTVKIKPFFIDKTEVTNAQYQKFLDATSHPAPPSWKGAHFPEGAENLPVTDVAWNDASAYADWAGKRLPTEEEWEFAARGDQGRLYPWGEDWKPDTANAKASEEEKRELMPVGQFIQGASIFGVLDMTGNAWEWTASDYAAYPGGKVEALPNGFSNPKVIRGGSYQSVAKKATATLRRGWPATRNDWPSGRAPDYGQTGFRCVQDVKPQ